MTTNLEYYNYLRIETAEGLIREVIFNKKAIPKDHEPRSFQGFINNLEDTQFVVQYIGDEVISLVNKDNEEYVLVLLWEDEVMFTKVLRPSPC